MPTLVPLSEPPFKPTTGWLDGFLKRFPLSLRVFTTSVFKNASPVINKASLDNKINSFRSFIQECKARDDIQRIWNMDETPVWLDMPAKRMIHQRGAPTVSRLSTGSEGRRVTVVLCCSDNGDKMAPIMVVRNNEGISGGELVEGIRV